MESVDCICLAGTIEGMLERFRSHLEQSGLIPSEVRVLVGYSGGADSTCLLHLMSQAGVDVVAAHLHHGQRDEADKELKLCEAFAESLDVPFVSGKADVPKIAADRKIGLEEAGREARYSFFRQAAFRLQCARVATAHTQDDQAETVLLHLTRGAGLSGLGGIPVERGEIIRPMLPFSRDETISYCREQGFWFHDDPANSDISFSRARIRHRVIPELSAINPAVRDAISRMAELVGEEDRFLNGMAAATLERAELPLNGALHFLTMDSEAAFDADHLRHLPTVLLRRGIRLAVETIGGTLSFRQTLLVVEGLTEGTTGSVTAEGGDVVVEWEPDRILIRELLPTEPFRYPLTVPGETTSEEFGWKFEAWHEPSANMSAERRSLDVECCRSAIKGPLFFRTAESGDAMIPLGFDHPRKLTDLLSDAKLTHAARRRLPIVCDLVGPIWAPGVCLAERARPTDGPTVRLRFSSLTS